MNAIIVNLTVCTAFEIVMRVYGLSGDTDLYMNVQNKHILLNLGAVAASWDRGHLKTITSS